jgi:hypothetical protein
MAIVTPSFSLPCARKVNMGLALNSRNPVRSFVS